MGVEIMRISPDSAKHQHGKRVIDHWLVINRHELLADDSGKRIEAGAGAPARIMPLRVIRGM